MHLRWYGSGFDEVTRYKSIGDALDESLGMENPVPQVTFCGFVETEDNCILGIAPRGRLNVYQCQGCDGCIILQLLGAPKMLTLQCPP